MNVSRDPWFVYILCCGDGTYYTGIAKDVAQRLRQHRQGLGAKYTRGRGGLTLVYVEAAADHGAALSREYAIKRLSRKEKRSLSETWSACVGEVLE